MSILARMSLGGWLWLGLSSSMGATTLSPFTDVAQVTAGGSHTCALTQFGEVWCWGSNVTQQLGLGQNSPPTVRATPVRLNALSGVRRLASGHSHNCAIMEDRSVRCWGLNFVGQSGDASLIYQTGEPTAVEGLSGPAVMLATGGLHSCALIANGQVECWGDDSHGQLGDGPGGTHRARAAAVQQLGGPARLIVAGSSHTCAALLNGSLRCWGFNDDGQLGDDSSESRHLPVDVQGLPGTVSDLAAGANSTCAISGGGLYCWGDQYPLQAFVGGSRVARAYPGFDSGAEQVVAGVYHYCVRFPGDVVRCLGESAFGQFGTGPIDGSLGAEATVDLDSGIVEIAAGGSHTCARSGAGGLQCWGDNFSGQLGNDDTTQRRVPTQVLGLNAGVADIGIGAYHSCALTAAGAVKCWGSGSGDRVGDGTSLLRLSPVDVPRLTSGVRSLDVGASSSCVITAERRVQCWGFNYQGQLGIDRAIGSSPPTPVLGLGDVDALDVKVGRDHACALLAGGMVRCWGSNQFGQLGDGSTDERSQPVEVTGLGSGVKAIGVGFLHSCAITSSNAAKCWGFNTHGQLGDGSTTHRPSPVDVVGLQSGVLEVGPGGVHSCAIVSGGAVKCWGEIRFDDGPHLLTPGDVPGLESGVRSLAISLYGSCALLESGALQCWGDSGVIGDNSGLGRPLPTQVAGLNREVSAVDTGYGNGGHACAVVAGAAKCWGENIFGALGDGTSYGVPTPQTVVVNALRRRVNAFAQLQNAEIFDLQLDGSGRYALLRSDAASLVPGDDNGKTDAFILDRQLRLLERASLGQGGGQLDADVSAASMSADARLVAFVTRASAVPAVLNETAKARAQRLKGDASAVFLRNMLTGSTQMVAAASEDAAAPQVSASGNAIVYTAPVDDPAEGELGQDNVYLVPLTPAGGEVMVGEATCVSCKPSTEGGMQTTENVDGAASEPVVSADGSTVAYSTQAKNAVAGSSSPCPDAASAVLLRNLLTGATQQIAPPPGTSATACGEAGSSAPSIDYSGSVVVVQSDQALDPADANAASDIYAISTVDGGIVAVSAPASGGDGNGESSSPQVSGDGQQVAFVSTSSNLDLSFADSNDSPDLHTAKVAGGISRLSQSASGGEAESGSRNPTLNYDGSQVAFVSSAAALTGLAGTTAVLARENPQAPTRKSATWWVPSEAGWGFTVFDQGDLLTPTWFTYDADGEPTWFLVAGAFPQDDGSFRGDLLRFRASSFNAEQAPNEANAQIDEVGEAVLRYQGEQQLQFDYSVDGIAQGKTLRRFPFGARNFSCSASASRSRAEASNYTDLWSGAEAGSVWGLTLFHVDALLVAIWYTYDDDGEAVFFVITAVPQENGVYDGTVFRQPDGTAFSAIDGMPPSGEGVEIGSARFRFLDGERAEFSHTIDGITRTRSIQRLLVGSTAQVCQSVDAIE